MGGWSWGDEPETPRQALERRNAVRQADQILELVTQAVASGTFALTIDVVCALHKTAMEGLVDRPGVVRTDDVTITGSRHEPPAWRDVEGLLLEMCDYVNERHGDAIDQAAYVLWRLNWIHPFAPDGNGRTARAVATVVLFARLQRSAIAKAGSPTFMEHLAWRRFDYQDALEAADKSWQRSVVDVSMMSTLLFEVLQAQLVEPSRASPE